ncbi:unnamed protein product [Nyctereutes procyonoides]|uniref:(raccoon dog) hypothetical protein n=1 Tax=Nyctereutes procyonoides TaxID=34880 RepID=A0A811ZW47_NYCPR|nr:unnamed protein product [Nyctereutes procyonoides]
MRGAGGTARGRGGQRGARGDSEGPGGQRGAPGDSEGCRGDSEGRRGTARGPGGGQRGAPSPGDPGGREGAVADRRRWSGPAAPSRGPAGGNCGPGYKENLPSKYFTKHRPGPTGGTSLNSLRGTFSKKGLDDFRRRCPPHKGLNTQAAREAFAAPAAPGSKQAPASPGAQKALLADVKAQLTLHPLALYPQLGEDMPVEVLEVLDPDRRPEDAWAYCQGFRKRTKEPAKLFKKLLPQSTRGCNPKKTSVSHPGQWLNEEKKPSETDLFHEDAPLLHENVHKGVRDFCNWATALGSSNIVDEFILKQFDIDYQSKPSHDVLHTRRLNQVPLELKKRVGLKKLQKPQYFQKLDYEQKHQKPQNPHNAKCVKMRYGAWYLDTKLWKKQRADEPLLDPKVSCKAQGVSNTLDSLDQRAELLGPVTSLLLLQAALKAGNPSDYCRNELKQHI